MSRIQELKRNLSLALQDSKWERALGVLEKLISLEEKQPAYHNQTGDVFLKMGRRAEAIESFLRGVKAYRDLGMYPNGGALCKKVLRLEPDHREAIWILGELKTRQGFLADGADKILDALRLYGEDPSTTKEMLLELLDSGLQLQGGNLDLLEHAAATYTRLSEVESSRSILLRIAEIEERDGNKQRAEKLRQEAGVTPTAPPPVELKPQPAASSPADVAAPSQADPILEAAAEPAAATPVESFVEPPAEPATEAPVESFVEAPAEPATEAPVESFIETPPEPVDDVQAEKQVESILEAPAAPTAEPQAERQVESIIETPAEPAAAAPVEPSIETVESSTLPQADAPARLPDDTIVAKQGEGPDAQSWPAAPGESEAAIAPPEKSPLGSDSVPTVEEDAIIEASAEPAPAEPEVKVPEDLESLLEAVDEADPQTDDDAVISRYAISDPEPLDVALRNAVEEVMKEGTVSDWPQSLPEAAEGDPAPEAPAEARAEPAAPPAETIQEIEEAQTPAAETSMEVEEPQAPAAEPTAESVEPAETNAADRGDVPQEPTFVDMPAASMAEAMETTTPDIESLRTLEELPPWQPSAVEASQDELLDTRGNAESAPCAPVASEAAGDDDALPDEELAEASGRETLPGEEAESIVAETEADWTQVPELERSSQGEDEAAELLAEAESKAKDDWLGLSDDAAPESNAPAAAMNLQPFEIKDVSAEAKPNKGSSNGDGKRDSLANISVGLMGSERELCTDQVEQVFAEFRHRMADQLGNLAPEERYQLGISYMEMGLVEEALEEFEPCLEHGTFGHQAREWMARCLLQLERPGEVVRLLEQPLDAEPYPRKTSVELYYLLGQAYELLGQRDRALDAFNKVYQLDTEFRDVQSRLENLTSAG